MSNTLHDDIKETIRAKALELGFDACGFARAERVDEDAIAQYNNWIESGKNDCMEYAARYKELRDNPTELFPNAKTIICVALNYYPSVKQAADAPQFSVYAYGDDYHEVLRKRLKALARFIETNWNSESRICVDTAPIREKYWARKAGIGMIGRNHLLIIPGKGSFFFLGELITTLQLQPDPPCADTCGDCRRCEESCPGGALNGDSGLDARRCLSCQLIERRGELPAWVKETMGNRVYGCDTCQMCCPHNQHAMPTQIEEFDPSEAFLSLTLEDITDMSHDSFINIFRHSAVKRAKLDGLKRNANLLK